MNRKLAKQIKIIVEILLFSTLSHNVIAQENQKDNENWFKKNFEQRIYFGFYNSFGNEKAGVVQAGYDAVLNFINIMPDWNLLDFCLGVDALFVRDQIEKEVTHEGEWSVANRFIPALELNCLLRLHFLPIPKIKTSLYVEAAPKTFVVYAKPYPDGGTRVNIGTHLGLGMKYSINDHVKGYTTIRLFSHTSNGKPEAENPCLDMVGVIMGLQF
jgi:hypothetical protein